MWIAESERSKSTRRPGAPSVTLTQLWSHWGGGNATDGCHAKSAALGTGADAQSAACPSVPSARGHAELGTFDVCLLPSQLRLVLLPSDPPSLSFSLRYLGRVSKSEASPASATVKALLRFTAAAHIKDCSCIRWRVISACKLLIHYHSTWQLFLLIFIPQPTTTISTDDLNFNND